MMFQRIFVTTAALLLAAEIVAQVSTGPAPSRSPSRRNAPQPELQRVMKQWGGDIRTAQVLIKSGKLGAAETLLIDAEELGRNRPLPETVPEGLLARVYSNEGREREAYQQMRLLFHPLPGTATNQTEDPVFAVYYGDLCCRFGDEAGGRWAYVVACKAMSRQTGELLRSLFEGVSSDEDLVQLRAAALAAANLARKEPSYGAMAVHLDPGSPLTRLSYALALYCDRTGTSGLAYPQFRKAYELADGHSRALIATDKQFCYFQPQLTEELKTHVAAMSAPVPRPKSLRTSLPLVE